MQPETVFMIMLGILFVLAIFDLIVGVSNDAVNFLISAIGSKVAPFFVIMIVAGLGVVLGAVSSSGMMEVARKGIFNPSFFTFNEIMVIFLAVMLTDVILLDVFNTLGMPTSTTVSIVFELLGAAVAMAIIILSRENSGHSDIGEFINTGTALIIILGILLSVVVSFTLGAIIQYFSRLVFSFNYKKSYKYFGAIWGSLAVTSIFYFMIISGMKGISLNGQLKDIYDTLKANSLNFMLISFVSWTIILGICQFVFKFNILKFVVLVGTFALAMAFAGNDLVNFIGVPLAGLASYREWISSGMPHTEFLMGGLAGKVATPTYYLVFAGFVMVLTLFLSKKARYVTETSVNLSRQDEGYERFESNALSRSIVRFSMNVAGNISGFVPDTLLKKIDKRFVAVKSENKDEIPAFDLVRASVNLMVAGILITIGTSFKLPLSTTYVTFMVAMGTSLADRAWGRESAVYRVSGVLSVIGGWFITALVAFTVAFVFACIIYVGTIYAVIGLLGIAFFSLLRTNKEHKKRQQEKLNEKKSREIEFVSGSIYDKCNQSIVSILKDLIDLQNEIIEALLAEDRKSLKALNKKSHDINEIARNLKYNVYHTVVKLREDSIDTAPYYVQVLDYLIELSNALLHMVKPCYEHINNNHKTLSEQPTIDLQNFTNSVNATFNSIYERIKSSNYEDISIIFEEKDELLEMFKIIRKKQIKRIKAGEVGTRNSILFLNLLTETKNIVLFSGNLLKAQKEFVKEQSVKI